VVPILTNIRITLKEVLVTNPKPCFTQSEAFGPYFHSNLLESHFMPKCDVFFSSIGWSIMIKLYQKQFDFGRVQLND
jgi:hypothetical protein